MLQGHTVIQRKGVFSDIGQTVAGLSSSVWSEQSASLHYLLFSFLLCVSPTLFINTTLDFKLPRSTAVGGTGMKGRVYWRTHSSLQKVSSQLSFSSPVSSLIFVFGVCRDTMWSSHSHITENVPLICRLAVREGFSPWGPQAILSLLSNASPPMLHAATAKEVAGPSFQ